MLFNLTFYLIISQLRHLKSQSPSYLLKYFIDKFIYQTCMEQNIRHILLTIRFPVLLFSLFGVKLKLWASHEAIFLILICIIAQFLGRSKLMVQLGCLLQIITHMVELAENFISATFFLFIREARILPSNDQPNHIKQIKIERPLAAIFYIV